ncbi:NADH dehydrogenase (ubiquinone) acyl carrier protein isoform X2 [Rhodnius prolixus]|uniref:Acyl carrier protein n=1 Tax=Rhodnius prolixus TaxID=13249 RepID=R4G8J6_RHOPR
MAAIVQTIRSSLFRNSSVIKRTFIRTTALGLHSNVKKQIFQQNSTPKNSYLAIKRSASSSNLDPAKRSEIETRVMSVIKAYDKITADKLTLETHFINDLGLDSLDHVEVIMAMEDEFGFEIPDADAEKLLRPADIIRYVGDRQDVYE